MKVKVIITKAVECEIDDEFRRLAVPFEETVNLPESLYSDCTSAVEKATGIPVATEENYDDDNILKTTGVIDAVYSVEDNEMMMEF